MPGHANIDERHYEMHRVIVSILRTVPSSLNRVVEQMAARLGDPDYSESLKDCVREWFEISKEGIGRVIEVLQDRSDEGDRPRQNSRFAILIPQDVRTRILQK